MSDIAGEETPTEARAPMRPKPVEEGPKERKVNTKMETMAERMMKQPRHIPHIGPSITAAKGTPVDGLMKHAQMSQETRMPVRAPAVYAQEDTEGGDERKSMTAPGPINGGMMRR